MNNPGAVSIWLGNCKSEDSLREYVDIKLDDSGGRVPSRFLKDFSIHFTEFDQDLLECTFIEHAAASLSQLLKNASYAEAIINELAQFYDDELPEKYNAAIRLYDFEYEEIAEEAVLDGNKLTFIGSVMYEE